MRRVATTAAILVALLSLAATTRQTAARNGGIATLRGQARATDASSDALIHADATRALGYTGRGVTVAILDTGIDRTNTDLASSVIAEHCFVPPDGCPDGSAEQDGPGSAQDDEGHGTAMAAIIAGHGAVGPTGVAPDASLVVVKVADRNGRTTTPQIIAGLNWVREHHPEAKVVNISLGSDILLSGDCSGLTPTFIAFAAAVDELRAQGTTVFASSGNRGQRYSMTSPACLHSVAAVGAVYSRSRSARPGSCRLSRASSSSATPAPAI